MPLKNFSSLHLLRRNDAIGERVGYALFTRVLRAIPAHYDLS